MDKHAWLRQLRLRLDLTQEEMAGACRVSTRTWRNWETGVYTPAARAMGLLVEMAGTVGLQPEARAA